MSMTKPAAIAEAFPPGEFIKDEMEERGWSQTDLAAIIDRPVQVINELIAGKRSVTIDTARELGEAFGTGPEFWLKLETTYQLWKSQRAAATTDTIARRARLYIKGPIKEMQRRGWLEKTENLDVLEPQVIRFFGLKSMHEQPAFFAHAARKGTSYESVTLSQWSWLFRARQMAEAVKPVAAFTPTRFEAMLTKLRTFLESPEEVRHIPRTLSEAGVRLVLIEPLPQTRIDGASFWLTPKDPVVALSLRYDRIDALWFTLGHELGHLRDDGKAGAGPSIDIDLVGEKATRTTDKPPEERRADEFAMNFLIAKEVLINFIKHVRPLYSKQKIAGLAGRLRVHPGIVVGQLQHRREITYAHSRETLVKIRHLIAPSALTDGWGHRPQL